jgi:hypothetical protein
MKNDRDIPLETENHEIRRRLAALRIKPEHIKTNFDYPPIPIRKLDWSAIDSNTYDASYEGEDESGSVWKCSPSGHGATEEEAVNDLIEKLEEKL